MCWMHLQNKFCFLKKNNESSESSKMIHENKSLCNFAVEKVKDNIPLLGVSCCIHRRGLDLKHAKFVEFYKIFYNRFLLYCMFCFFTVCLALLIRKQEFSNLELSTSLSKIFSRVEKLKKTTTLVLEQN